MVLALKGSGAAQEVEEAEATRDALGAGPITIHRFGVGTIEPPTTVVVIPTGPVTAACRGRPAPCCRPILRCAE